MAGNAGWRTGASYMSSAINSNIEREKKRMGSAGRFATSIRSSAKLDFDGTAASRELDCSGRVCRFREIQAMMGGRLGLRGRVKMQKEIAEGALNT